MAFCCSRRAFLSTVLSAAFIGIAPFPAPARDPLAGRFGGAFSLVDHDGRRVSEADFAGRFQLIYFGFTRCTDTCPIDLPQIAAAIDRLGRRADIVQPIFITVDPRDTPEELKAYLVAFHPRIVGLTGSEPELAAAARAFRVHRRKLMIAPAGPSTAPPGAAGRKPAHSHAHSHNHGHGTSTGTDPVVAYTIDHGSLIYLMGPNGQFLTLLPHQPGIDRLVEVIGKYLP